MDGPIQHARQLEKQRNALREQLAEAQRPSLGATGVSTELLKRLHELARERRNLKFAIIEQETCVDLKGDLQLAVGRAKQNMDDAIFALIDADFDLDSALSALSPLAAQPPAIAALFTPEDRRLAAITIRLLENNWNNRSNMSHHQGDLIVRALRAVAATDDGDKSK